MNTRRILPILILTIFLLNLGSVFIHIPQLSDEETKSSVPHLRGEELNILPAYPDHNQQPMTTKSNPTSERTNDSYIDLQQIPIRFDMAAGDEDDVDNNLSNVDGVSDIGIETGFSNAQGSSADSVFMTLEEDLIPSLNVTVDSVSTAFNNDSNSVTVNHTVSGTNRFLLVFVQTYQGERVSSVSFDSDELNYETYVTHSTKGRPTAEIWSMVAPPVGTYELSVNLAILDDFRVGVVSYTGVNQTHPFDQPVTSTGYGSPTSVTISSRPGDLVQDSVNTLAVGSPSPGSTQTERWNGEMGTGSGRYGAGSTSPGDTSVTMEWSSINKEWVMIGVNIRKARTSYDAQFEYQWTDAKYTQLEENLSILTGSLGSETLKVDVWTSSASWETVIPTLSANSWNNFSILSYLNSPIFTIRIKATNSDNDFFKDSWNIDIMLLSTSSENNIPQANNITLSPDPVYTRDNLTLNYDYFDQDGDPEGGTEIRWMKWNVSDSNWASIPAYDNELQLVSSALFKGDVWRVSIQPYDGLEYGNTTYSNNITVSNSPPTISSLEIFPIAPKTGNDLTISYDWDDNDSSDFESDSIIIWYLDNGTGYVIQEDLTNETIIPSNRTKKNDLWKFGISPSDGEDYGLFKNVSAIIIQNTPPTLIVSLNNFTSPNTVADDEDLVGDFSYYDADSDPNDTGSLEIRWYYYFSGKWEMRTDNNDSDILADTITAPNDLWRVEYRISDGTDYSEWYSSPTISIGIAPNDPPSALYVNLSSSNPVVGGSLYVDYTFYDPNGDNESVTLFRWYRNSVYQSQFDGLQNLSTAQLVKGDEWFAEVRPGDDFDFGNWTRSENITISNTAPLITETGIYPEIAYTSNDLIASFEGEDIDGDPIIDYKIVWHDGVATVFSLENHTTVPNSFTSKDQIWTFQVWLYDGSDWSLPISLQPGLSISNSIPSIENVTITGGINTSTDVIISYDFVDIDGDSESVQTQISWRIFHIDHFILNPPTTVTLPSSWITAGDLITCTITPHDGDGYGLAVDSSLFPNGFIVVGNSAPYLIGNPNIFNPQGGPNFTASAFLKVNYTATDPDQGENPSYEIELDSNGYVIGSNYRWYRNNQLIFSGPDWIVVDPQYLTKGDIWIVSVQPRDGWRTFGAWVNSSEIEILNTRPEVRSYGYTNGSFGLELINSTFRSVNLFLHYDIYDIDSDGILDIEILWYFATDGNYSLRADLGNSTQEIGSEFLLRDQSWYATLRVFDGSEWSNLVILSYLNITNTPPTIYNSQFMFDNSSTFIIPNERIDEFYAENEDINLTYGFFDADFDSDFTKIQWIKIFPNSSWIEMLEFENQTIIPYTATETEEIWYAILTPSDGNDTGTEFITSQIKILSKPIISYASESIDLTMDCRYNITAIVSDISSSNTLVVRYDFILPNGTSFMLNTTRQTGNKWYLRFEGIALLDLDIQVIIYATTSHEFGQRVFHIMCSANFNFTVEDKVPPRVLYTIPVKNHPTNPTNITIYAYVEERVSQITEIILTYTITNKSSVGIGSILTSQTLIMEFVNKTGFVSLYIAVIIHEFTTDSNLTYSVGTEDSLGNKNNAVYSDIFEVEIEEEVIFTGIPPELMVIFVSLIVAAFLTFSGGLLLYRQRQEKKASVLKATEEKLSFLTDTYTILVTSAAGVPIWNQSNILYQADESLTGTLSGLSVGIDAFLESFQADFMSQMSDINLSRDHPEAETSYRLSVIEQNQIQIMILGSVSYRIFVFLKEVPSSFLRNTFLKVIKDIQQNLALYDTGVINEDLLGPNIRRILRKYLPIGLLSPFKIDLERLEYFDSIVKQKDTDSLISKPALNVLKFLVVTSLTPPTTSSTKQALLRLYPQTIANYPQSYSGIFLYSDVMRILEQVGGFPLKDVSEALWMGIDDRVNILVPF